MRITLAAAFLIFCLTGFWSCKDKKEQTVVADAPRVFPGNAYASIDQSPLDVSYCPHEYPLHKINGNVTDGPVARVIYSRPHRKGRSIFGQDTTSLCMYGKPWRLGANEATEIEFFRPVIVNGQNVAVGKYVMYCVPYADKWIIVLNTNLFSWGLQIDPAKDVLRFEVPISVQSPALEDFTIVFSSTDSGADLIMSWDSVKAVLPISFSK